MRNIKSTCSICFTSCNFALTTTENRKCILIRLSDLSDRFFRLAYWSSQAVRTDRRMFIDRTNFTRVHKKTLHFTSTEHLILAGVDYPEAERGQSVTF